MKKILRNINLIIFVFLILFLAANSYCGWRADRVMSKSGIGDQEQFLYWENLASIFGNFFKFSLIFLIIGIVSWVTIDVKDIIKGRVASDKQNNDAEK